MSLSRLLSVLSFSSVNEKESELTPKNPVTFDALTSRSSKGVRRAYFNNNVLSMFVGNTFYGSLASQNIRAEECLNNFIDYGHRDDKDHDSWHKNKKDFEIDHTHIMKDGILLPEEFQCLLDNIMRFQKGFKYRIKKNNLTTIETEDQCIDVSNPIILSQSDYDHFMKKYSAFYEDNLPVKEKEKIENDIHSKLDQMSVQVVIKLDEAAKAAAHSFFTTLFLHYLKPYLIYNKGFDNTKMTWACEMISAAFDTLLTASPIKAGFDFLIRNTMKAVLLKIGIDVSAANKMAERMGTLAAITENPTALVQLCFNYTLTQIGQDAAYAVIHALPKLKEEPKNIVTNTNDAILHQSTRGLTRRITTNQ